MKKGDVIQLAIIILALIIAINSLQYFFDAVVGLLYAIGIGEFSLGTFSPAIVSLLVTLLYVAICWQLLTKSRSIADFIYEKANIGTSFKIISRPADLLFILFIVTGVYFLIENLPPLIKGMLHAFKTKGGSRFELPDYDKPTDWTILFIRLLLPLVLLMGARPFANYFAKNVDEEPVMIGEDIGDNDENEIIEN
jgi:hypothetical protein